MLPVMLLTLGALTSAAAAQSRPATQESQLEGASFVLQRDAPNGDWQHFFFRIQGRIVRSMRQNYIAQSKTLQPVQAVAFPLAGNTFYIRFEAAQCFRLFVTDDCAIRGTIKEDGIYFNYLINGQVADERDPTDTPRFVPRQN
jgi:hypothetical protein